MHNSKRSTTTRKHQTLKEKNMKRYVTTILIMSLALGSICYSAENSAERPAGVEAVAVEAGGIGALAAGDKEVLIIKDYDPWDDDGNVEALDSIPGKTWDIINTGDIATTTLSDYRIVIVASDQTTATYDALIAAAGDIADYVSGGGVLLAHGCDDGWNWGHWSSSWLPGGVGHVNSNQNELSIVDATSPIVDDISDAALDNWSYSTHGYLTNLPGNANIIIGITGNPTGQPTYIEYGYGSGLVLASMQTMEWPWAGGAGTQQLLINEIEYAQAYEIEVVIDIKPGSCPNPFNPKSKGSVPVAIVGTETLDGEDLAVLVDPTDICLLIGTTPVCALDMYEIVDSTEPTDSDPFDCDDCFDAGDPANFNCDLWDATAIPPGPGTDGVLDAYCGDGILDFVVKFDAQEIAEAIEDQFPDAVRDDCIEVILVGATYAGRLITGADSIVLKIKK